MLMAPNQTVLRRGAADASGPARLARHLRRKAGVKPQHVMLVFRQTTRQGIPISQWAARPLVAHAG